MSPEQMHVLLWLAGAFAAFVMLMRWALGYTLAEMLGIVASMTWDDWPNASRHGRSGPGEEQRPWVARAHRALGSLRPPPRKFGTLEGWTWRPIERDPNMTVRVRDRSPDGRRLEGYIIGTPGTLQASCRVPTRLKLIDGWMTLTGPDSTPVTLRAGDSLVIEPGFHGSWQNETIAHLHFRVTLP